MPRPQNKPPRQIVVRSKKTFDGTRYDVYQQMAVLFAACGVEGVPFYFKEDKNGSGGTIRVYIPDDTIECWLDFYDDLEGQVRSLVHEAWGRDTYREAAATTRATIDAGPLGASDLSKPTSRSRKGGEEA